MEQLSKDTLKVLQNFSQINQSIYVKPGNTIKTVSPQMTILGQYECEENWDQEFALYDLRQFLSCYSLLSVEKMEFYDNHMTLKEGDNKINYYFCNKDLIKVPPDKEIKFPKDYVSFDISEQQLKKVVQAASVLQLQDIRFSFDSGFVKVECINVKNPTSNKMELVLGQVDEEFDSIVLSLDNLNIKMRDYGIRASSKIVHFSGDEGKLQYWVASKIK